MVPNDPRVNVVLGTWFIMTILAALVMVIHGKIRRRREALSSSADEARAVAGGVAGAAAGAGAAEVVSAGVGAGVGATEGKGEGQRPRQRKEAAFGPRLAVISSSMCYSS